MNDIDALPRHLPAVRPPTRQGFAPYGEIIEPLGTGGQGADTGCDPENSAGEARLVLGNAEVRFAA